MGRTGCFLALDNLILHMRDHDWVDIFGLACEMRQHRNHMIQTEVSEHTAQSLRDEREGKRERIKRVIEVKKKREFLGIFVNHD